ncbi:hypothetical protein GEMRC1_002115 [Eukaryota sp. GEM-RC1]
MGACCGKANPRYRRVTDNSLRLGTDEALSEFITYFTTHPHRLQQIAQHLEEVIVSLCTRHRPAAQIELASNLITSMINNSPDLNLFEFHVIRSIRCLVKHNHHFYAARCLCSFVKKDSSRHVRRITEFIEHFALQITSTDPFAAFVSLHLLADISRTLNQSFFEYLSIVFASLCSFLL